MIIRSCRGLSASIGELGIVNCIGQLVVVVLPILVLLSVKRDSILPHQIVRGCRSGFWIYWLWRAFHCALLRALLRMQCRTSTDEDGDGYSTQQPDNKWHYQLWKLKRNKHHAASCWRASGKPCACSRVAHQNPNDPEKDMFHWVDIQAGSGHANHNRTRDEVMNRPALVVEEHCQHFKKNPNQRN